MFPLTKLISSGLTGLSASGLGAYFTPGILTETGELANVIYSGIGEEIPWSNLNKHTDKNKEKLEKLNKLFKDYSDVINALISSTKKEHNSITDFFGKVQESEEKLRKFYEKNKGYLEQFQKFISTYYETSEKKLQIEKQLKQVKYLNQSLLSLGNLITNWGLSLEKFLCAINNQKGDKDCSTDIKEWLKNGENSISSDIQQSTGGGTGVSQDALRKLKDASEKIKEEKEKLRKLFTGIGVLNFVNIKQQSYLEQKSAAYEKGLLAFQELQKQFNDQIQKIDNDSNNETTKLNENYNQLQNATLKWEKLKKATSFIHKWKGNFQNSICELNLSAEKIDCPTSRNI